MLCKNCGFSNKSEAKFCKKCGEHIVINNDMPTTIITDMRNDTIKPKNRRKLALTIMFVILGLLILGSAISASVYYFIQNKRIKMATEQQKIAKENLQKKIEEERIKAEEEAKAPDTIPPKIDTNCGSLTKYITLKNKEERVCIKLDSWTGYLDSVNSVPVTGKIEGDVKSITVDGKNITWDENKQIYQRINLYIYGGLNKYKVVAEDMSGNKSTGYVETTAEKD